MRSVSIIIPTLNEEANISPLLQRLLAVTTSGPKNLQYEILVSDGASQDNTCAEVVSWQEQLNIRLIRHERNPGLAGAVFAAARQAKGELVVVMDSDLSHPPEAIPHLLAPLLANTHDLVIGSRYVSEGETPDWPIHRRIFSRLATIPARIFTDVKDPLAGFVATSLEKLLSISHEVHGFKFGLELLATGGTELRVLEIPIVFRDRHLGESKMGVGVIVDYLRQLAALCGVRPLSWLPARRYLFLLALLLVTEVMLWQLLAAQSVAKTATIISLVTWILAAGALFFFVPREEIKRWGGRGWLLAAFIGAGQLTLVVRNGLALAIMGSQTTMWFAEVLLVALASLCTGALASMVFVFSIGRTRLCPELAMRFYGLAIVISVLLVRLLYLGVLPLTPIELATVSLFVDDSLVTVANQGGAHHWPGTMLLRFGNTLLWLACAVAIFNYARDLYARQQAFQGLLVFALLPANLLPFFVGGMDIWCMAVWILLVGAMYRALVLGRRSGWWWGALLFGILLRLSPWFTLAGLVALCYLAATPSVRHGADIKAVAIFFLGAGLIFLVSSPLVPSGHDLFAIGHGSLLQSLSASVLPVGLLLLLFGPVYPLAVLTGRGSATLSEVAGQFLYRFVVGSVTVGVVVLAVASSGVTLWVCTTALGVLPVAAASFSPGKRGHDAMFLAWCWSSGILLFVISGYLLYLSWR